MAAPTPTTASQDVIAPTISGPQASAYLLQLISLQLKKTGFDGVEAGALAEVLRLTERYTHTLYTRASSLAAHSSRPSANAKDVFEAYHSLSAVRPTAEASASSSSSSRMTEKFIGLQTMARRTKRARRKGQMPRDGLELRFTSPPPSPPPATQLTLSDDESGSEEDEWEEVAIAGVTDKMNRHKKRQGARANPSYLFEGAPRLPPEHSYRRQATVPDTDGLGPQNQTLSTTLLSFIKATAVERGDIPSELGLVDYRRAGESETTASKKRRWTVRAVGDGDMS